MVFSKRPKGKGKHPKPAAASPDTSSAAQATTSPTRGDPTDFTRHQSFEQLKIVALALTSRIAHHRNLFPNINWHYRKYDPTNPDPSYQSFVDDANTTESEALAHIKNWIVLPRGQHRVADQLLDWLEQGVSQAIELGYLKKFELAIHSSDAGPSSHANKLESYAMSFSYGPEPQIGIVATNGTPETLAVTKTKVYELVDNFSTKYRSEMATVERLPRHIRLGMLLAYNDTCPRKYQPPLFKAGDDETLKILQSTHGIGELTLDTGFHELSVGWSTNRQLLGNSVRNTSKTALQGQIARPFGQMVCDSQEFGDNFHGATTELQQHATRPTRRSTSQLTRKTRSGSLPSSIIGDTQQENLRSYETMQLHRTKDMSNTQPLSSPSLRAAIRPTKGLPLPYNSKITDRVDEARHKAAIQKDDGHNYVFVNCGCNSTAEQDLIECEICESSQHQECYGYNDFFVVKKHVCYRCLDPSSGESLDHSEEMSDLCVKRRALYFLQKRRTLKAFSIDELSECLAFPEQDSTELVLKRLEEDQVLRIFRKDNDRAGVITFALDLKKYLEYFDPAKGINEHMVGYRASSELARGVRSSSRSQSVGSLHTPPSSTHDDLSGNEEAGRMYGSVRDDGSTTASDDCPSPEDRPAAMPSVGRQTRSGSQTFSLATPLERKRKAGIFEGKNESKKLRPNQTGRAVEDYLDRH